MTRTLTAWLIAAALCTISTGTARAAGINLYWNDCSTGGAATANRNFACDTNVGLNDLYVSYDPPPEVTSVDDVEFVIDLQSATSQIPDWWRFKNVGSCRLTALTLLPSAASSCPDPWLGQGVGAISAYYVGPDNALPLDRARIVALTVVPSGTPNTLTPGTEYFAAVVRISNAKTVGLGACAGCLTPVCIVLSEIALYPSGGSSAYHLFNPLSSNFVGWQGGMSGDHQCFGATPTTNHTWGRIKTLYR